MSLQSHRIPSSHPPNDHAHGVLELLRPPWCSLTPYQEPAGKPSYRNLLWSGAGTQGGTASPLSGPFLLEGLPYSMDHRLRGPSIRSCKGGELGVTASELGGLLYTCRTHMWTWAMNRFGRTETRRKKKASEWKPNCRKWIHFQTFYRFHLYQPPLRSLLPVALICFIHDSHRVLEVI